MQRIYRASRLSMVFAVLLMSAMAAMLVYSDPASAAATLGVSPSTGLAAGDVVTVTGTGFDDSSTGAVLECNNDASQPTIAFAGNTIPVSCTDPLDSLNTTTSGGDLSAKFTIKMGTVGPPTTGTDSSGGSAATDAASYPCPPTPTQVTAGDSCVITFGDEEGAMASSEISFGGGAPTTTTTTGATTTTTTGAPTTTTTTGVITTTTTAATTTTTHPSTTVTTSGSSSSSSSSVNVVVNTTSTTQPPVKVALGTLAFTGAGHGLWFTLLGGLILLDLGYLVMTMFYRPRELARMVGRSFGKVFGAE
jgi:Neocarzinostatin family